jgi:hypothetical protein
MTPGQYQAAIVLLGIALVCAVIIIRNLARKRDEEAFPGKVDKTEGGETMYGIPENEYIALQRLSLAATDYIAYKREIASKPYDPEARRKHHNLYAELERAAVNLNRVQRGE